MFVVCILIIFMLLYACFMVKNEISFNYAKVFESLSLSNGEYSIKQTKKHTQTFILICACGNESNYYLSQLY